MKLSVHSEIGPLQSVLVHRPGLEVDSMPPAMMEKLLFDDIIYGPGARHEHDRFTGVMRKLGVDVFDFQQLLSESLQAADDQRAELLETIRDRERVPREAIREIASLAPDRLAAALIQGLPTRPETSSPEALFRLRPIPNLLFSRDAQVVLADGILISGMRRKARRRESLLSRFIFRYHPELAGTQVYADFSSGPLEANGSGNLVPTLEGGDVLILNEGIVLVGVSERTMEPAVDAFVVRLRELRLFDTLIMVPMPRTRSVMHLDTIFTRISESECLVYAPMILPGEAETLSVLRIDLHRSDDWGVRRPSLLDALAELGLTLEPVCCGGQDDYIQQAREQWTDGANSFAIRPGVILLYARNAATAFELDRRGYQVVSVDEMDFSSDGKCQFNFVAGEKYAVLVAGHELSRARGGPRCMTMPLSRTRI